MSDCFQVLTVSCWCKLWFRIFYYICSLMKALHLTNEPCNCLRLFSKHSCSGTVLWFFFHCCLWYLTHVDTVMRYAGMNGLNFCMVEGENCRLYFRHICVLPFEILPRLFFCESPLLPAGWVFYFSVYSLCIWLFDTLLNVDSYILYTHTYGLEVFKFLL